MKGSVPAYATQLIEFVLVIALVGIVLFMTVPQVSGWITKNVLNPLSGQGIPLGSEESAIFEAAIKCSYFRCVAGCGAADTNIMVGVKNCDEKYCVPFQQNGRVCGNNAQQHPVVVTLLDNQFIDKAKIKQKNLGYCITTTDSCTPANGNGWISIDKSGTSEKAWEEETCGGIPIIGEIKGYSRIMINAGKYNLWTNVYGGTVACLSS